MHEPQNKRGGVDGSPLGRCQVTRHGVWGGCGADNDDNTAATGEEGVGWGGGLMFVAILMFRVA